MTVTLTKISHLFAFVFIIFITVYILGLIETKIDNGASCFGSSYLGAQINQSNRKRFRNKIQTAPSSSLMYCNN